MGTLKQHRFIFNFSLLILLSLGMTYIIYKRSSVEGVGGIIAQMDYRFIVLAILFFVLYRSMEGLSFYFLFQSINRPVKLIHCIKYSVIGYFFSQITPSGGGGQPGQVYAMSQDGISVKQAISVILPFNLMYHVSLSVFGLLSLVSPLRHVILSSGLKLFFYVGLVIQLLLAWGIFLAIKKTDKLSCWLIFLSKKIEHQRFLKRFYKSPHEIDKSLNQTRQYLMVVVKNKQNVMSMFLFQLMMLFFYYGVAYWTYRALGYHSHSLFNIVAIQCLIIVATEYIPTPGTAGFAELSMYNIYQQIVPNNAAVTWMLVNRLLMLYLAIGVTLVVMSRRNMSIKEINKNLKNN